MEMLKYVKNKISRIFIRKKLNRILTKGLSTPAYPNTKTSETLRWLEYLDISKTEMHEILDISYSENKKYTKEQKEYFSKKWLELQDEVFLIEDSPESRGLIKKNLNKLFLVEKIRMVENYANLLIWYANKESVFIDGGMVDNWIANIQGIYANIVAYDSKLKIQYFEDINVNIKLMESYVSSLVNQYNTSYKELEQKIEKKEKSIFYSVMQVNKITGFNLNASTMLVVEWIEASKEAVNINKSKRGGENE